MLPQKIGRYEILAEIGRGGMAAVYRAHDPLFGRQVALKALHYAQLSDPVSRQRFAREARIIAALEHPFIVPVYDFGEENEQPYLVMRFLSGGTLKERLETGPLAVAQITQIVRRLAQALDHAHQQAIIHRDLKPGNVLFDQYDNAYLADFGIARLVNAETASLTSSGVIGTPAFMSPEQIYGNKPLDGRSDIYSLGILLFLMLTGQTPFSGDTPARLMMQHLLNRVPPIELYRPDLPSAMATIIAKALAKESADRYGSATALAAALAALPQSQTVTLLTPEAPSPQSLTSPDREGEPTAATADLPQAAVARSARPQPIAPAPPPLIQPRHLFRTPLDTATDRPTGRPLWVLPAALIGALLLIIAGATWLPALWQEPTTKLSQPEVDRFPPPPQNTATATMVAVSTDIAGLLPVPTPPVPTVGASGEFITVVNAAQLVQIGQIGRGTIERVRQQPGGSYLAVAGGAGLWLYDREELTPQVHLDGHDRSVRAAAWSPDGRWLASGSDDGTILVWDASAGTIVQRLEGHRDWIRALSWAPDGLTLLSGSSDGTARLWDVVNGSPQALLATLTVSVRSAAWSADGRWLAVGLQSGELIYFDQAGAEVGRRQGDGSPIISLAWQHDDAILAAGALSGRLTLWRPDEEEAIADLVAHSGWVLDIAWSQDGQQLITSSTDKTAKIWTLPEMTAMTLAVHNASVTSATWRNASTVVTGGVDGTLRIWRADSGEQELLLTGHLTSINAVALSPAGDTIALGLSDNSVRIWDDSGVGEQLLLSDHSSWVSSLAYAPDGSALVTADFNGQIRLWDAVSGELQALLGSHRAIVNSVSWSPAGRFAASGGKDNVARIWDTTELSTPLFLTITHSAAIETLAFSPDGSFLATGDSQGRLIIWQWQARQVWQEVEAHAAPIRALSWSSQGELIATASSDGEVTIWNIGSGEQLINLAAHEGWANSVSWSRDDTMLATAGFDGTIKIWSVSGGDLLATLSGHRYAVWSINWSLEGQRLLSGSGDGTVRIWGLALLPP